MSISDDDNSGSDFVRLHPVYEDEIGNDNPVSFEPINTYHPSYLPSKSNQQSS
jgi:hypothetical protein